MSADHEISVSKPNGHAHIDPAEIHKFTSTETEQEMPPTRHDDLERVLEAIEKRADERHRELVTALAAGGGGRKPPSWAAFALSCIAVVGSGVVWVGNSGMSVGQAALELKQAKDENKRQGDDLERLKVRFDKLRDLYLVQFGADPEDPNTKTTMKRK